MTADEKMMLEEIYTEFVDKFGLLTPYQLNHFCSILHQHYSAAIQPLDQAAKNALTAGDIKEILIRSMQATQLSLAERKLKIAEYNLEMVKTKTYQK